MILEIKAFLFNLLNRAIDVLKQIRPEICLKSEKKKPVECHPTSEKILDNWGTQVLNFTKSYYIVSKIMAGLRSGLPAP